MLLTQLFFHILQGFTGIMSLRPIFHFEFSTQIRVFFQGHIFFWVSPAVFVWKTVKLMYYNGLMAGRANLNAQVVAQVVDKKTRVLCFGRVASCQESCVSTNASRALCPLVFLACRVCFLSCFAGVSPARVYLSEWRGHTWHTHIAPYLRPPWHTGVQGGRGVWRT